MHYEPPESIKAIALLLLQNRDRLGLSQAEMADMLDVDQSSISRWESGARVPDLLVLDEIARRSGVHLFIDFVDTEHASKDDTARALSRLEPELAALFVRLAKRARSDPHFRATLFSFSQVQPSPSTRRATKD